MSKRMSIYLKIYNQSDRLCSDRIRLANAESKELAHRQSSGQSRRSNRENGSKAARCGSTGTVHSPQSTHFGMPSCSVLVTRVHKNCAELDASVLLVKYALGSRV